MTVILQNFRDEIIAANIPSSPLELYNGKKIMKLMINKVPYFMIINYFSSSQRITVI